MLIVSFLSWWYGRGWLNIIKNFSPRTKDILENFSVKQLIRTWFEPWKRIVTYPGDSLEDKAKAWGDNLVSRAIGFVVRTGVLIGAILTLICFVIFTIIELIVWPLLPPAVPALLILGVIG